MNEEIKALIVEYHKTKSITVACQLADKLYAEIENEG